MNFAILMLNTLRVVKFGNKDELGDAVKACRDRGIKFIILKYHHGLETWVIPESYVAGDEANG